MITSKIKRYLRKISNNNLPKEIIEKYQRYIDNCWKSNDPKQILINKNYLRKFIERNQRKFINTDNDLSKIAKE